MKKKGYYQKAIEKALLVGVKVAGRDRFEVEDSLEELGHLARTAGAEVLQSLIQERPHFDSAHFIGRGKAQEIAQICREQGINLVLFDDELTPSQQANLEAIIQQKVLDRTALILDIFAQRAYTKEGKLQVELAQLDYLLPRLVGKGLVLSRLGGGIGTRGPGETKLEVDRRHIRSRIFKIRQDLEKVRRHRGLLRISRKAVPLPIVGLVGYTNVGKSSLLNVLTSAQVLVEDKLFATLDPTVRRILLPSKDPVLLVDTVGFIRKLPHQLIAAFRATLEEVLEADLLLHVIDLSHPQWREQKEAVEKTLEDIGAADKERISLYNKIDQLPREGFDSLGPQDGYLVSAKTKEGLGELMEGLSRYFSSWRSIIKISLPYHKLPLLSWLHRQGKVLREEYQAENIIVEAEVPVKVAWSLAKENGAQIIFPHGSGTTRTKKIAHS